MKKYFVIILSLALILGIPATPLLSCTGKTLYLGITNTPDEQLLAEVLSVLINERTGTTIKIKPYADTRTLYQAVQQGEVSILIEDTDTALAVLGKNEKDARRAYDLSKEEFRKKYSLVWLEPFGLFSLSGRNTLTYCGALLTTETINNFPALPRVINKLSGQLNQELYHRLMSSLHNGVQVRTVAKDFLKSRKLI